MKNETEAWTEREKGKVYNLCFLASKNTERGVSVRKARLNERLSWNETYPPGIDIQKSGTSVPVYNPATANIGYGFLWSSIKKKGEIPGTCLASVGEQNWLSSKLSLRFQCVKKESGYYLNSVAAEGSLQPGGEILAPQGVLMAVHPGVQISQQVSHARPRREIGPHNAHKFLQGC